jgi:cyanophycin synthetase
MGLAAIDLELLDEWVKCVQEAEAEQYHTPFEQTNDTELSTVAQVAWRQQLLLRSFFQAASIPVFDAGKIVSIARDENKPSQWLVTVRVVHIDHLPIKLYLKVLETTVGISIWMMKSSLNGENRQKLYNTLNKQIFRPLNQVILSGKSTIPVLQMAHRRGIPFLHVGIGVYQLGWGRHARLIDRSSVDTDSAIGLKLSRNKVFSANLLRMAGLPAPVHGVALTEKEAVDIARHLGWPVVVKPADLERGEGVAVDVANDGTLVEAYGDARKLSPSSQVIVERQVSGVCHRFFIANGTVLYVVKRSPKSVKGDGTRSIARLVADANRGESCRAPWKAEFLPLDDMSVESMAVAGFSPDSIPAEDQWVPLRKIESTQWGGRFDDVTTAVHPDNVEIAVRAAAAFALNVVGVDMISPDISVPWHENGAIINEVNYAPLLGGTDVSRSYLLPYFETIMGGDGRIPVEVFAGGSEAEEAARNRQQELVSSGVACYLSSHVLTLHPSGMTMAFPHRTLSGRCVSLLMNRQVEALILLVQTDELLLASMPIDRITSLVVREGQLTAWNKAGTVVEQEKYETLISLLKSMSLESTHVQ